MKLQGRLLPALLLFFFLPPSRGKAQGALSHLERSRLAVEGRLLSAPAGSPAPWRFFEVSRVLRGPSGIRRLRLALPEGVSAHKRPLPGKEYLLFLVPLPAGSAPFRAYTVLQFPFGAVSLDGPGGREFARHVLKLSRALSSPARLAAELLKALESPHPFLVLSAAYDLEAHPGLLPWMDSAGRKRVLARLLELGPSGPWAEPLVHVLGDLRPPGWDRALAGMLASPGGAGLAPAVGQVLGNVEGGRAVEILAGSLKVKGNLPPALVLALGAARGPEALPLPGRLLREKRNLSLVLLALTYDRSWRAVRLLRQEVLRAPATLEKEKKEALLEALSRIGTRPARRLLLEVARGKVAPELSKKAAALLKRK